MYISNFTIVKGKPVLELSYKEVYHTANATAELVSVMKNYNLKFELILTEEDGFLLDYIYWD